MGGGKQAIPLLQATQHGYLHFKIIILHFALKKF